MESMLAHFKSCSSKTPSSYTCRHCQKELQSASGMKYHLITSHHDMPSSDNSATDSTELNTAEMKMILKKMGKLACRNEGCSKTFTTYQGFQYHQKSCGKEAEAFTCEICGMSICEVLHIWRVVAERHQTQALVFMINRVWARVPFLIPVSLSKTFDHYCFVLWMGRKAIGPMCCVLMHIKEPSTLC